MAALARLGDIEEPWLRAGLDDAFTLVAGRFFRREVRVRARAWLIEHPLVAEGGAAVLWPNPVTIDFAALGEGEVRIVGDKDSEDAM